MKIHGKLAAILLASVCLGACSVSSESYIADISGYSVTRGRFMQIENLHAAKIEHLTDGVAMTLSQPGCRVKILFDNDEELMVEPGRGGILVHGYANDYILKVEVSDDGSTAAPSGR